jgi:hypothetical protein
MSKTRLRLTVLGACAVAAAALAVTHRPASPEAVVRLHASPELTGRGATFSLRLDEEGVFALRVGEQRLPSVHGENDVLLRCPQLDHAIPLFRHFVVNRRHPMTLEVSCDGTLDEIRCRFVDADGTETRTTSCSKHDPLHAVW